MLCKNNIILIHGFNGIPKVYNWLQEELSKKNYNVIIPEFPPQEKCNYSNWSKILDKYTTEFNEKAIVIAHSIGNEFIIKYCYKNKIKMKMYIALAGFAKYFECEGKDILNLALKDFQVNKTEIEYLKEMETEKYAIYSNNDHIVPLNILKEYPKGINAIPIFIEGIGHMGKKSGITKIDEIIKLIEKGDSNGK